MSNINEIFEVTNKLGYHRPCFDRYSRATKYLGTYINYEYILGIFEGVVH